MKSLNLWFAMCLFLAFVLFPLFAIENEVSQNIENNLSSPQNKQETFRILFPDTGEIKEISARDYIIGVVGGEMPASYETEALKAQAVAAYTYAQYKRNVVGSDANYDLSAASESDQKFLTEDELKEKYKDGYDEYYSKIAAAVDAVLGQTITYEGNPIFAAYHSISSGKTEFAENVWGEGEEYLISVESTGDIMSKDYLSEVTVPLEEFSQKIKEAGAKNSSIGEIKRSDAGTVLSVTIGEKEFSGREIRNLFSLRSANFDINQNDENVIFTVRGYGHNVGMSQFGAQFMALQGSNYIEILSWYYPKCKLN